MKKSTKKTVKKTPKKITKEKVVKNGLIKVHNPVRPEQEFFVASELADDSMIEGDIVGKAMESYVYSFWQDNKEVTGLSVKGVNETARLLTKNPKSGIKIRILPDSLKIERDVEENGEKGIQVLVIAENMVTGETGIGAKFESYTKPGKNGRYKNTFALEKAVSKAERNAKRKLIPENLAIEQIKKFMKSGQALQIEAPRQENRQGGYNPGIRSYKPQNRANSAPVAREEVKTDYEARVKSLLVKYGANTGEEALRILTQKTGLVWKDFENKSKFQWETAYNELMAA